MNTPPFGPQDPSTPIAEAAVAIHEMFMTWVRAGFTEDQALRLIAYQFAINSMAEAQMKQQEKRND